MDTNEKKMTDTQTLGIWVHSDQYFEYVLRLTEAAWRKEKLVRLFLSGPGLALLQETNLKKLSKMAQIIICHSSRKHTFIEKITTISPSVSTLAATQLMSQFRCCDRQLVF
jgi:hypothetical protein